MSNFRREIPSTKVEHIDAPTARALALDVIRRDGFDPTRSYSKTDPTPLGERSDAYVIGFALERATVHERTRLDHGFQALLKARPSRNTTTTTPDVEAVARAKMISESRTAYLVATTDDDSEEQ